MNRKLLFFSIRQNWPFLVICAVLLLLVMVVPAALFLPVSTSFFSADATQHEHSVRIFGRVQEFLTGDGYVFWAISAFLGLLAGGVFLRFLNRNVSANFWHSAPVRREQLFLNDLLVYAADYLVALLVNAVLYTLVVFSFCGKYLTGGMAGSIICLLLSRLGIAVLLFAFVFAVVVFASALTGTDSMRVLLSLMLLFYPVALYFSAIQLLDTFSTYTDWQYYLNEKVLLWLVPIARPFLYSSRFPIPWYGFLLFALAILVLLGLSLLLYRRRKTETAGVPVLHKVTACLVKYSTVLLATAMAGLLFQAIGGSILWMVFGFAAGMLLSFMMINAILEKSPKAMFRRAWGLAVFAGVFAVLFVLFPCDALHLDSKVPMSGVKSVQVSFGSYSVTVEEDQACQVLNAFNSLMEADRQGISVEDSYVEAEDYYGSFTISDLGLSLDHYRSYYSFSVVIRRGFGLPLAKKLSVSLEMATPLLEVLRKVSQPRSALLSTVDEAGISSVSICFSANGRFDLSVSATDYRSLEYSHAFLNHLMESSAAPLLTPQIGEVIWRVENEIIRYPLYLSDYEALVYAAGTFVPEYSFEERDSLSYAGSWEEVLSLLTTSVSSVLVYDQAEKQYTVLVDREDMLTLLAQCVNCCADSEDLLVPGDSRYLVWLGTRSLAADQENEAETPDDYYTYRCTRLVSGAHLPVDEFWKPVK